MTDFICESGMKFIPDDSYHIEAEKLYKDLRDSGICSVEFIRIKGGKIFFLEAKSSFADPANPAECNRKKYVEEISEICDKFVHSLNLFASVKLGVADAKLPESFNCIKNTSLVFVLVIRDYDHTGLRAVSKKIVETLPKLIKDIWKPEIFVINHKMAIKRGLAVA